MFFKRCAGSAAASLVCLALAAAVRGDEPLPYDGIQAGFDAYARGEAERLEGVRRQVQLNDALRWQAGFPPANGVFYDPLPPAWADDYSYGFAPWNGWGFRYRPSSRQSIGRIEVQTGPDRWESHPVYAAPPLPAVPPPLALEEREGRIPRELSLPREPLPLEEVPPATGPRDF